MIAQRAREEMVATQIEGRGVHDPRVLAAMREVPRHEFVPRRHRDRAHEDNALETSEGQTISQPYIVGLMLEALALRGEETVLEIGTGSGYQTALLVRLARRVVTIERLESLHTGARERLRRLGLDATVTFLHGDGTLGHLDLAPYDGIVVTAAGPRVPTSLTEQLAEGGRLVMPLGERGEQMLVVTGRDGASRDLCPCRFVPLIGEHGHPA